MPVLHQAVRYGGRRVTRRLTRSIPWIGTALALFTIGDAIRRKGLLCGSVDCTLNAVPFVGAAKNLAEIARGRDFLPDRRPRGNGGREANRITRSNGPTDPNGVALANPAV
jgi:hypothetical protein